MSDSANKPVYLVDASSDPVVVRIDGRACFQNSGCLRDFITAMLREKKIRFVVDFQNCLSLDSTFLGVLAGTALELKKTAPGGSLVLARVGPRNLELIRNLGLHRLVTVDSGDFQGLLDKAGTALTCTKRSELENAKIVLEAHENLVSVDEANRDKFQDVLTFLKTRLDQK